MTQKRLLHQNESGQAVTEYILLLIIVAGAYMTIAAFITNSGLAQKLTSSVSQDFAKAYQYGDPTALGYDDGGPKNHPRANNRMFINPSAGGGDGGAGN
jgi:hypothetical protein